ncbi:MAG: hypothetical protein V1723_00300 [Candidatus Uhrbacteria bacterium]
MQNRMLRLVAITGVVVAIVEALRFTAEFLSEDRVVGFVAAGFAAIAFAVVPWLAHALACQSYDSRRSVALLRHQPSQIGSPPEFTVVSRTISAAGFAVALGFLAFMSGWLMIIACAMLTVPYIAQIAAITRAEKLNGPVLIAVFAIGGMLVVMTVAVRDPILDMVVGLAALVPAIVWCFVRYWAPVRA